MRYLFVLAALAPSLAMASGGMSVDFKFDEDGKASPETTLPYKWNENWYSELKQRSLTISETDVFTGADNPRSAASIQQDFYRVNFIGYTSGQAGLSYGFTAGLEYIKLSQDEFGFGDISSSLVAYELTQDVTITQAITSFELGYSTSLVDVNLGFDLVPAGTLTIDQETSVRPDVTEVGSNSSSHSMDVSYGLNTDVLLKTGLGFDLGLFAEYKFLPYTYDYAVLNGTRDGFVVEEIEQEETTTRLGVKVILGQDTGFGRPVFGYTQETLSQEVDGESTDETIGYIVVGLDKRF